MYERFYGLSERAFELTPDPRFLLLTTGHREALGNVEYGIAFSRGFTLLLGEAGTGKTTILRKALSSHSDGRGAHLIPIYLNNPTLTRQEFIEFLADKFGLGSEAAQSKTRFLRDVEAALAERRAHGDSTVLVIDEAQSLPHDLLEELRLLGNIESNTEKLLPLILAGQPELGVRLNEPQLRQLKQRIALRCTLTPLNLREVAGYIAGRLRLAGGDPADVFTRDAVVAIHRYSHGIPRTISVICDNALLNGMALERQPIDEELIDEVCHDFDLVPTPPSATESSLTTPSRSLRSRSGDSGKVRPFQPHSMLATSRFAPPPPAAAAARETR
jgi:general secretion pathway protein A